MENNEVNTENNEDIKKNQIEENLKEILNNIKKQSKISDEELKKLEDEAKKSLDFLRLIDKIEIPKDKYVVFTDGQEQLYYENGEFFIISTTDSTKEKRKKKKKEASELYVEYFIKYILNKIDKTKKIHVIDVEDKKPHCKGKNESDRHIQNRDRIYIF